MQSCGSQRLGCGFVEVSSTAANVVLSVSKMVFTCSRSGEPSWSSVTSSPQPPPWSKDVNWVKSDVLRPSTYRSHLEDTDAVVHTMGILLEADYKGVISGRESPISGLRRAFSASKRGSAKNPLERGEGNNDSDEGIGVGEKDGQITYELMNRDSALSLASEAQAKGVGTYAYISAAAGAPMLPARYITTKREAESLISSNFPRMRSLFFRPGLLYDSSRSVTIPIMAAGMVGHTVNEWLFRGGLTRFLGASVEKPIKADLLAEAVIEGIAEEEVRGVQQTKDIEALAAKAWRKSML